MENNHFYDDLNDVKASILEADVISLFFPNFRKSVLIDTRSNDIEGSEIILTPMAKSPQDRVRSLETLRPGFPQVENMILIPWLRYVSSLRDSGIWDLLIDRLSESSLVHPAAKANAILQQLDELERLELMEVVIGNKYQTIWPEQK
jgi:hypothetical protein